MSSTLLNLPDELLEPILTLAAGMNPANDITTSEVERDTGTIASVCSVSKRLHRLALPLLLHGIHLGNDFEIQRFLSTGRQNGRGGMVRQLTVEDAAAEGVHKVIGSCLQVEEFSLLTIRAKVNLRAFRFSPKLRHLELSSLDYTMSRPALLPVLTSLMVAQVSVQPYLVGHLLSPDSTPSLLYLSIDLSPCLLEHLLEYPDDLARLRTLALRDNDNRLVRQVTNLAPSSMTVLWTVPFAAAAFSSRRILGSREVEHVQVFNTEFGLFMKHPDINQASLHALIDWVSSLPLLSNAFTSSEGGTLPLSVSSTAQPSSKPLRTLCLPNTGFLAPSNKDEYTSSRENIARLCALRGITLHRDKDALGA